MKYLISILFCINLHAEYKSNIGYEYIFYNDFKNESVFSGDVKLKYEIDKFTLNSTIEYLYSSNYDKKRYVDINELYISYEFLNSNLYFGKQIKYWGELEGYNVSDIFNKKRYLRDPFDKDRKIGAYTLNDIFYFDSSSLEIGSKLYEEDIEYPNRHNPYYPFNLDYSSNIQTTHSKYTPTIYLKYSFSTELFESENKIILWHGYDSKRVIVLDNQKLRQKAYESSKVLYLSNIIYEDYIFKFEGVLTNVKSDIVSDYAQLSFGVEKSIYDIKDSDLGIYLEYYKYKYFNESQKNIDISEIYNDDIFLALKLNLNDANSTEIKAGILIDRNTNERVSKLEFSTRIIDGLILNSEALKIESKENSVLTPFKDSTRVSFGLTYSF